MPAAAGPQARSCSAPNDDAVVLLPLTTTGTGTPSTLSRSLRHVDGTCAATGRGPGMPGMATSAIAMGSSTWFSE
jgi:hypothetical protein